MNHKQHTTPMQCPHCQQTLREHAGAFVCPQQHGALVTGRLLHDIETTSIEDELHISEHQPDTTQHIACPHCRSLMHKVDYNMTKIIIDTCRSCHYRWLDQGEIQKIKNFKPQFSPQDALALAKLEESIRQLKTKEQVDHNPEVVGFRTGRILTIMGRPHIGLGIIGTGAVYTAIRGMHQSKFLRVLIPILLTIIIFVYYQAYKAFDS